MNFGDFRQWSLRAANWSADYLSSVREFPVRAQVEPGDTSKQLAESPPLKGEPMADIFSDFEKTIMPGMTHWQHPRFFAYFPANASPPSVIAEQLTAVLGAQCMLWQTSPAATELETRVLEWLRQMIGLDDGFRGVIQDSASSATLAAILTARERALNWSGNSQGLSGQPRLRFYCSEHVHSSIDKAIWIAGIGSDNLMRVKTTSHHAMDPSALEAAIRADQEAGYVPAGVIASVGGTSVGGSDDLRAVTNVAKEHDLYVHVDAAWAGSAMICPEFRSMIDGVDQADSFVFNPHKWLLTNFDCSAHFVRAPEDLLQTLAIQPEFLKTLGRNEVLNYSEWGIPLGRRFRALKLWFVIRAYGVEALQSMIRNHVAWAEELAGQMKAEADFEVVTPPVLSLFSFRYRPAGKEDLEAINKRLLEAINNDQETANQGR